MLRITIHIHIVQFKISSSRSSSFVRGSELTLERAKTHMAITEINLRLVEDINRKIFV